MLKKYMFFLLCLSFGALFCKEFTYHGEYYTVSELKQEFQNKVTRSLRDNNTQDATKYLLVLMAVQSYSTMLLPSYQDNSRLQSILDHSKEKTGFFDVLISYISEKQNLEDLLYFVNNVNKVW